MNLQSSAINNCKAGFDAPAGIFEDFARRLDPHDIRIIREALWDAAERFGAADLETVAVSYKIYEIEAIRHYEAHAERGGDSYCGIWEQVEVVDLDEIEVVGVYDIFDGRNRPELVNLINRYAACDCR